MSVWTTIAVVLLIVNGVLQIAVAAYNIGRRHGQEDTRR